MQLVSVILIRWIVIYPVDSAIQCLNNRDLISVRETNCAVQWIELYLVDDSVVHLSNN